MHLEKSKRLIVWDISREYVPMKIETYLVLWRQWSIYRMQIDPNIYEVPELGDQSSKLKIKTVETPKYSM